MTLAICSAKNPFQIKDALIYVPDKYFEFFAHYFPCVGIRASAVVCVTVQSC